MRPCFKNFFSIQNRKFPRSKERRTKNAIGGIGGRAQEFIVPTHRVIAYGGSSVA